MDYRRPNSVTSFHGMGGNSNHDGNDGPTLDPTIGITEGWLELFLTPSQKRTFSKWNEYVQDKSFITAISENFFSKITKAYIPDNIAPNLLTLCGFACLSQAWYVTNLYGTLHPTACTWFAIFMIIIFFCMNGVDFRHADYIRQHTPLSMLFKYSCDCCSTVFLAILTVYLLGGTDPVNQWYAVQASQLLLFLKHLSAFHRNDGLRYNVLSGPGEVIMSILVLLIIRAVFGLDWMVGMYELSFHKLVHFFDAHDIVVPDKVHAKVSDPAALGSEALMIVYYGMYISAVIKTLMLRKPHGWSRFGLATSLLMRFLPAIFMHFGMAFELTVLDVICDGLFMAVLTSDVMLSKMAGREIHPLVVLMSMAAVLSHSHILALVMVYYIAIFGDLCHYLNAPLLTICRNVYCDGVYDLCHIGHKNVFRNALGHGNRLFVGVMSDEDCGVYKRKPIMTHEERCAEVEACKSVTKVIPRAPCFGLTQEFIEEHQIHIVAFGEEYLEKYPDPAKDPYYGYPRKIGIARPLPRTQGLSTTDLIRRMQTAADADEKNSPT